MCKNRNPLIYSYFVINAFKALEFYSASHLMLLFLSSEYLLKTQVNYIYLHEREIYEKENNSVLKLSVH